MFLLTHWKGNRRITTEMELFFSSIPKSVTICLLNFSKLISIVSWGEIVLLVTLYYCDPLPGLLICRSRGNLSPRTHGKIIKWHDETPTKTTILFLPKETRLMWTVETEDRQNTVMGYAWQQPTCKLAGAQVPTLPSTNLLSCWWGSGIPSILADALCWTRHFLLQGFCHTCEMHLLTLPGQGNWFQSDSP